MWKSLLKSHFTSYWMYYVIGVAVASLLGTVAVIRHNYRTQIRKLQSEKMWLQTKLDTEVLEKKKIIVQRDLAREKQKDSASAAKIKQLEAKSKKYEEDRKRIQAKYEADKKKIKDASIEEIDALIRKQTGLKK